MTYDELVRALLGLCPEGTMCEDNFGNLVWYTNLTEQHDGTMIDAGEEPYDGNM
jgi:hypothetical protein